MTGTRVPEGGGTVRVIVGEREHAGTAIELGDAVGPSAVAGAIAGGGGDGVRVETPEPGPLAERASPVVPETSVRLRAILATAARSLGRQAPQIERIERLRRELADLDPPAVSTDDLRQRRATLRRQRRRVADRLRGTDAVATDRRRERLAEYAEAATAAIAADERLDEARERARAARDLRERRLSLEDEIANLRREARRSLAGAVYDRFTAAVAAVPGEASPGESPDEYEGDGVTAALAAIRVADVIAPVVVATGRFADATAANRGLGAPVVRTVPPEPS